MIVKLRVPAMILAILSTAPIAAQQKQAPDYGWHGKGELGLVSTSGNSDTRSIKLALEFIYGSEHWRHRFTAGLLNAEDEGETTAKRYDLGAQSDYKLSERSYVFGAVRYEKDDFSAFDDQTTVTFGYGRQLLDSEVHQLKVESGVGYRTATLQDGGGSESDAIARGVVDWKWKLTSSTDLTERLLVESGSDNTFLQNDLGLVVAINSHLALKAGFQVRHNTEAPAEIKRTDTLTSANIVYQF